MKTRITRMMSALLVLCMLVSLFPAMVLASDVDQAPETTTSDPVPAAEPTQELFVSDQGDDDTGSGSKDAPYATLQKAVEAARDGAVIYVMTDLEVNSLARVTDKHLTITSADAENPVTLTRGSVQGADNNQSHYNSAMIEVMDDFHFHLLRHTYTTNLLSHGAAPKDVQELLGHSDVSTTMNIYAHATREAKRTSARLLDKVVGTA